jgi:hypothetical protein
MCETDLPVMQTALWPVLRHHDTSRRHSIPGYVRTALPRYELVHGKRRNNHRGSRGKFY